MLNQKTDKFVNIRKSSNYSSISFAFIKSDSIWWSIWSGGITFLNMNKASYTVTVTEERYRYTIDNFLSPELDVLGLINMRGISIRSQM